MKKQYLKSFIDRIFAKVGLELRKIKEPKLLGDSLPEVIIKETYAFSRISPNADYSPWLTDELFLRQFNRIIDHTLVDIYRCYELWNSVGQAFKANPKSGLLEVGVWRGGTAAIIAEKLRIIGSSAPFFIADTFMGVVKASEKDSSYSGGEHSDTDVELVKALLSGSYQNIQILEGIFPNETSYLIPEPLTFSFCHIDVDVYESARDIVNWIWEKLVPGGIIIFDDYGFANCTGIIKYVNELQEKTSHQIFYNLNGHAILIKGI